MENLALNIYLLIGLYVAAVKSPTGTLWLAKIATITLFWPIYIFKTKNSNKMNEAQKIANDFAQQNNIESFAFEKKINDKYIFVINPESELIIGFPEYIIVENNIAKLANEAESYTITLS